MLSLLQKSRKIFDPADHDQPRKRKAVSPVVNVVDSNAAVAPPPVVTTTGSSLIDGSGCIYCGLTSPKQRKGGRQEALVRCNDCPTTGLFTTSAMRWLWLTPYFSPFAYRMTWCVASIKFSPFFLAVHPSCMDYSEKLIKKIVQLSTWQCTNCKTCQECHEANDDVRDKFRCMHYADLDVL